MQFFFAAGLPSIQWQPSDLAENLPGVQLWIDETELDNIKPPIELDVLGNHWPDDDFDAAYTANTCHIMSMEAVKVMFWAIG